MVVIAKTATGTLDCMPNSLAMVTCKSVVFINARSEAVLSR